MTYEIQARFLVFGTAFVEANSEEEARKIAQKGGSYIKTYDFQNHTAELDEIEEVKPVG